MTNIVRRANGIYYLRMQVRGRDVWRSLRCTTLPAARSRANAMRARITGHVWHTDRVYTFDAWADIYLEAYTPHKRAPHRDRQLLLHARPFFGRYALPDITPSMCARYIAQRQKVAADSTVARERGFLRSLFQRAVEEKLLQHNPWAGIRVPGGHPRIRLLSEAAQVQLLPHCLPRWQRWLVFMVETGLRLNECRHVQLGDWTPAVLTVRPDGAKFGKGREVPLSIAAFEALEQQVAAESRLWWASPAHYRDYLLRACRRAGVPLVSPHDLRHTFGTRMARAGMPLLQLSRIMGHSSTRMTERYYTHLVTADLVAARRAVEQGLFDVVANPVALGGLKL